MGRSAEEVSFWRTGDGQTIILGLIFFMIFLAYFMVQGYSANLFGAKLGSDTLAVLYAAFTVFCFVSPSITNTVGPRLTLFLGTLSYAVLVLAALAFMVGAAGPWVVILGGAINGAGSAITWTAQGRLMLQYADGERASGKIFQVFWSFFMGSAIIGGFVTFAYFSSSSSNGNVPLFVFFFFLIVAASMGTGFLIPPEDVVRSGSTGSSRAGSSGGNSGLSTTGVNGKYESAPTTSPLFEDEFVDRGGYDADSGGELSVSPSAAMTGRGEDESNPAATSNWWREVRETVAVVRDRRMRHASLLYLYVGLNQPYQGESKFIRKIQARLLFGSSSLLISLEPKMIFFLCFLSSSTKWLLSATASSRPPLSA